jgi:hypothetical protein
LSEAVSKRVVDQRLRNRIIEEVSSLAEDNDVAMQWGASEYFEAFFDLINNDRPWPNSCFSNEKKQAFKNFCALMIKACDATPKRLTVAQLTESGWPDIIRSEAQRTLAVFLARGRFGEDEEEAKPSFDTGQAWYSSVKEKAS